MFRIILNSTIYAVLITAIYFAAANVGYYIFNRRTMFADIYYYEWVEYVIVAVIMYICTVLIELVRNFARAKK